MNYYTVLSDTNALIEQRGWKLARCRRRLDGPGRYVVFDSFGTPLLMENSPVRNHGATLHELLYRLCEHSEIELSHTARNLLGQLNTIAPEEMPPYHYRHVPGEHFSLTTAAF